MNLRGNRWVIAAFVAVAAAAVGLSSTPPSHASQGRADEREAQAVAHGTGLSLDDARRSLELTDAVHALAETAKSQYPSEFAGAWRDNTAGGRVVLTFTNNARTVARELASSFPRPDLVSGRTVQHSLSELERLASEITDDWEEWHGAGIDITSTSVNVPLNRVGIGISQLDAETVSVLEGRYGVGVLDIFEASAPQPMACTRENCTTEALRAGLKLLFTNLDGEAGYCSSAFTATDPKWGDGILTAGHCAGWTGSYTHGGLPLGLVTHTQFGDNIDAEWIEKAEIYPQPISRWVWEEPWSQKYYISSTQNSTGGAVGDPICHSGYRRGYRCGSITSTSITIRVNDGSLFGTKLTDMKEDDICTGPGDSGGPVYASHRAHGVISASNSHINTDGSYRCQDTPRTYYSGIANIQSRFGITVKTS